MVPKPIYHMVTSDLALLAHRVYSQSDSDGSLYKKTLRRVDAAFQRNDADRAAFWAMAFLLVWNKRLYDTGTIPFTLEHVGELREVLRRHWKELQRFRSMTIGQLTREERKRVSMLFDWFEAVLKAVGAAKCLHVIAPNTFPLWDAKIAAGYGLRLRKAGENDLRYRLFVRVARQQCRHLVTEGFAGDPLKAIDEFNICKFTKRDDRFSGTGTLPKKP